MHISTKTQSSTIDFRTVQQLSLLNDLSNIDVNDLILAMKNKETRYELNTRRYNLCDAMVLHCMIRNIQPKRIVEVGCGMSSCMMLDTNERYFDDNIECTFIDRCMKIVHEKFRTKDIAQNTVLERNVQEVDLSVFTSLQDGDILFIDSSHYYAPGSDVYDIVHHILPVIHNGVHIHFHDVFYDLQYPVEWNNTEWNEQKTIFHILQSKPQYHVQFFTSYMAHNYPDIFRQTFPSLVHTAGGSLWLKKNML